MRDNVLNYRLSSGGFLLTSFLRLAICLCFVSFVSAQSANDGFAPFMFGASEGTGGLAVALQRDGKVVFGGGFVENPGSSRRNLTRLLADGTFDFAFNANVTGAGGNPIGIVYAVAIQPGAAPANDKILISGGFSNPRDKIARLNLDGSLDASFNPTISGGIVTDIVVQPADNEILICGFFTAVNGVTRNGIARLNADGSLDMDFNPNPTGGPSTFVSAIKVQKDNNNNLVGILVGGSFTNIGGQPRNRIARLEPVYGNADPLFNPNANGSVDVIDVQNSSIVIAGGFTNVGGVPRDKLARVDTTTGVVDSGFIPPTFEGTPFNPAAIFSLALQTDGSVIVGGDFLTVGGVPQRSIARLNRDGSHDATYNPVLAGGNFRTQVAGIAIQQDGKAVITGDFYTVNGLSRTSGARLERNGSLDQNIDQNYMGSLSAVRAITTQPDGKILIGGSFGTFHRNNLVRLNSDGNMDLSFGPVVDSNIEAILIQTINGETKIVIGGDFTMVNGQARNRIARLNADGTLDGSFDFNVNSTVFALALQSDGSILVGGNFDSVTDTINTYSRNGIFRLDTNSNVDPIFDPNTGGVGGVLALAVQPTNGVQPEKILVGGFFFFMGGQDRSCIARLDLDGTADSFDPSADSTIEDIAVLPNGKVMIAGSFTTLTPNGGSSVTRRGMARLIADGLTAGTVDATFADPNANDTVFSIAAQANGRVIAGGRFTSIGGQPRNRIARLRPDGTADSYNANANDEVLSLAIQSDGKALVGGRFTQIGGKTRHGYARLSYLDTSVLRRLTNLSGIGISLKIGQSHPVFTYVCFEQSLDEGMTWTNLGCAYLPYGTLSSLSSGKSASKAALGLPPEEIEYQLTGFNLPVGQNFLIRSSGYSGSGLAEQDVQEAFLLAPTAAEVSISGRVTTANGQGIRNARLTLTSPDGTRRWATTSTFGYYTFNGVEVGHTYVLEIASKRYTFANSTRVFSLQDELTGMDFTAEPQ